MLPHLQQSSCQQHTLNLKYGSRHIKSFLKFLDQSRIVCNQIFKLREVGQKYGKYLGVILDRKGLLMTRHLSKNNKKNVV